MLRAGSWKNIMAMVCIFSGCTPEIGFSPANSSRNNETFPQLIALSDLLEPAQQQRIQAQEDRTELDALERISPEKIRQSEPPTLDNLEIRKENLERRAEALRNREDL